MPKKLKILYAAGPGDVIGTYKHWVKGEDDPSQLAITYSGQFYEVCRNLNADAYVISSSSDRKFLSDGRFIIEHRPRRWPSSSGLLYHLDQLEYGLQLIASAVRFRANVAVVADGTTHWFVLSLLPLLRVQAIPSLHTKLWSKYLPKSRTQRLIGKLNGNFFTNGCLAILSIADDVSEQVMQVAGRRSRPIVKFQPTYRQTEFTGIGEPDEERSPFRVLFAGRIEIEKGVFDLLEIAKRFAAEGRQDITFDLCGTGSDLESLRYAANDAGLESSFVCHGHCNKPKMYEMLSRSHVIIVPTKTTFSEGFNKVVVEGILSARPVVTSAVCPSAMPLRDAVIEVPPDDINAYRKALLNLCDDREFYQEKRRHCQEFQNQFYDTSLGWAAALESILRKNFLALQYLVC